MKSLDPQSVPIPDFYQFMIASIAPRPIAFVSTVDKEGNPNLAPFSFFNAISQSPPMVAFAAGQRVQDGTHKDTYENVKETMECVINIVDTNIVRQMALTSVRFPKGVSEFEKAGLTPLASDLVKPYRVKESPVHFECKIEQILDFGDKGGAGHLMIGRIVRMHMNENILDAEGKRIDPHKLELVGRLGRAFYTKVTSSSIFDIVQPEQAAVIGFDGLPESIRTSEVLTGNNLAQIASLTELPSKEAVLEIKKDIRVQKTLFSGNILRGLHLLAQEELNKGNTELGTKLALLGTYV